MPVDPSTDDTQPPKPKHRARPLQSFSPAGRRAIIELFREEYADQLAAPEALPITAYSLAEQRVIRSLIEADQAARQAREASIGPTSLPIAA